MADLITLATLRTKVRQRADMVGSLFVTDAEVNGYIQDSYKELYDLLVDAVEDYNLSVDTASSIIASPNTSYTLPTDFYKLRGVDDYSDPANPYSLGKFNFNERNLYVYGCAPVYRLINNTIQIYPTTNAARQYRTWYVPLPVVPVIDADTINVINGFDEYVVVDAARKCLIKEESSTGALDASKAALTDRIYRMRANRDQAVPEKVGRVRTTRLTGYRDAYRVF